MPLNEAETLWLPRMILAFLTAEAERMVPAETGGILLGYHTAEAGDVVVTIATGPGPRAVHDLHRFIPDHDFHAAEVARLYAQVNYRLEYLGDWHTHPIAPGLLSKTDRNAMRTIALDPGARAGQPVMLILSGAPEWEAVAWIGGIVKRRLRPRRFHTRRIEIRLFGR